MDATAIRFKIRHPALRDAFDADWYYPLTLTDEHKKLAGVKRAIKEGWAEWIETEEDIEAIRKGFVYDLSTDKNGRIVYWHKGSWARYVSKNSTKLTEVDEEDISHVGAGDHACRFAELFLKHTKDPLRGDPYRFIHWQRKVALCLFGWVRMTEDAKGRAVRYRRYLEAMLEVAKKNAKSDFSSVIAVILMRADHTTKAFVYGAASDRNQARIIYNEARDYVKNAIQLPDEIEITDSKAKMVHWESGSTYEVISADAYRNDGYDAHGVLFDELHQQPNRALFAVMKKAGLARPQPLRIVTTTYGKSLSANTGKFTSGNIWAEEHLKTKAQLEGKRSNYRRFNMVASAEPIPVVVTEAAEAGVTRLAVHRLQQPIDVGEEIEIELSEAVGGLRATTVKLTQPAKRYQWHIDVESTVCSIPAMSEGQANLEPLLPGRIDHAIRRANPSVGITLELDRVRSEILDAVGPQAVAEALQLCLNIVSGGGRTWLSGASWLACGKKRVLPSAIIGQRCMGGFDVSLTTDLTSFWLAFPNWKSGMKFGKVNDPLIRLAGLVWVAGEEIERREVLEEVPYRAFAEMKYMGRFGYVRICPGPAIDYKQVGEDILEFCDQFKVQAIGYDPAYADLVVGAFLMPGGLKCIPHRQGGVSMGPPTKRFENMVKHGQIMHGNHPLLNIAIEGAVLETPDKVGNTYPSKGKSTTRIDPLMAAVMAVGWACDPPQEARSSGAWSGEVGSGIFG
jgi:phage terminase large subunit-like protein